jgi:CHAT domain-containing protein/Tfp pilus assembly protein PilF
MRCALLALLLVAGCQSRRTGEADAVWQAARADLRLGHIKESRQQVEGWLSREQTRAAPSEVAKFRLLRDEILCLQGEAEGALQHAAEPLPPDPGASDRVMADLEVRRQLVQGLALYRLRRYDDALPVLERAGLAAEKTQAPSLGLEARALQGAVLARLARYDEAERVLVAALAMADAAGDSYQQSICLNNLSFCALKRLRYDQALAYNLRALPVAERAGAQRNLAAIHGNLGLCYAQLGDFDAALEHRTQALALSEKTQDTPGMIASLGELGNLRFLEEKYAESAESYRKAYDIAAQKENADEAGLWSGNLAAAAIARKDWREAKEWNCRSEQWRRRSRKSNFGTLKLNEASIAMGEGDDARAESIFRALLSDANAGPNIAWEARAGLASVMAQRKRYGEANVQFDAALRLIEKASAELLQREESRMKFLGRLIRFYQDYVDSLVSQGKPIRALEVAESSRARILSERLRQKSAKPVSQDAQSYQRLARQADEVLLSYWLAPTRSFVWIVKGDGIQIETLPPSAEIAKAASDYLGLIHDALGDPLATGSAVAQRLANAVLGPVFQKISSGARVIVVPDGALHQLNLETVLSAGPTPHYWIEDVRMGVAPSLDVLERGNPSDLARSLLLIGAPDSSDAAFPKLPFAESELRSVAARFPAATKQVRTGAQATPAAYRDSSPVQFSVIHFAAHAQANAQNPLESAIVLTGPPGQGRLYAQDVQALPLRAGLVTISSCRSAGARAFSGEGLVGFAWAFLSAGAESVLAGLWDVNDQSTEKLMESFYQGVAAGRAPADALRDAKLAFVHSSGSSRKPYYWGPFQLYSRVVRVAPGAR